MTADDTALRRRADMGNMYGAILLKAHAPSERGHATVSSHLSTGD